MSMSDGLHLFIELSGWGDVGIHQPLLHKGLEIPSTPRLDKLAAEGITFTDFHTLGAECSPSRASKCSSMPETRKLVSVIVTEPGMINTLQALCLAEALLTTKCAST
jgi:arylsulfatase A-like enzyme